MPRQLGPLKIPWPGKAAPEDPYWDIFMNTPPADSQNAITEIIRRAEEGDIFPAKADLHTPEITSRHVKELAEYLGAQLVGIASLSKGEARNGADYPFAVVCAVRAEHDPRQAPGIGGQVPVQNGLFVTFVLSAWIRELGYRGTISPEPDAVKLAAKAGLGTLDAEGRLVTRKFGTRVHVADVILTDLPVVADG